MYILAVGSLQCSNGGGFSGLIAIIVTVLTLMFAVMIVCCSCILKYCKLSNVLSSASNLFCWLFTVNIVPIVIFLSILNFVFPGTNYQQEGQLDSTTMCQFVGAPTYTLVVFYLFIGLLCLQLSVTASCCYIGKQKRNHNIPVCHRWGYTDV